MRFRLASVLSLVAVLVLGPSDRAAASFHLWEIYEVFSNADGTVQYVELGVADDFENEVGGHTIVATSDGVTRTFTFPADLPGSSTAGRMFLVATPGFERLPGGVTPDYVLPCGPFFDPNAASIEIDFAGADSLEFAGSVLPKDGIRSMSDLRIAATSSPRNFAGDVGSLTLSACLVTRDCGACDPSDAPSCEALRACVDPACAPAPICAGAACYEEAAECPPCVTPSDCDDGNPCTTDTCESDRCGHAPTTGTCDDGRFCTATDACEAGACVGRGEACAGAACNEGSDTCGACTSNADCDDASFCDTSSTPSTCSPIPPDAGPPDATAPDGAAPEERGRTRGCAAGGPSGDTGATGLLIAAAFLARKRPARRRSGRSNEAPN